MFFSEVEVLRAPQSRSYRAAVRHVTLDYGGAVPNADAGVGVASVRTEWLLLLLHVYKVCLLVFWYLQQIFISYVFVQCDSCRPLGCATGACRRSALK